MEHGASGVLDEKAAESPVAIMEDSCSPVTRRGERDLKSAVLKTLPMPQLVDSIESQVMDEIAHMLRHGDGLVAGDGAQSAPVQVIEVRMGNKNEIDCREIAEFDSRMLNTLDDFEPLRPVGVNEHTVFGGLNQERGVSDPCHADFSSRKFGEYRLEPVPVTSGKKGRDDDLCKKVSPVPSIAKPHVHVILRLCALSCSQQPAHHTLRTILE